MVFVFRAKSQNNEKSNTELELFELLANMLLFLIGCTIKMLLYLIGCTTQAFLHIIAESILLLLTTMIRRIYPLLLPIINGLLASVCTNKVIALYINWRKMDTVSLIAELAAVTALAGLFCVAAICLYRLLKMLLFLVKTTLLIFYRLITDVILMVIITVKSLWTNLFLITVLVSATFVVQEQMTANMPSWCSHSFLLALFITILGFRISVTIMKIISRMMRFVLNLTAQVARACWYLIIRCMKPAVNILSWMGKWTLHVTLRFFPGCVRTTQSAMLVMLWFLMFVSVETSILDYLSTRHSEIDPPVTLLVMVLLYTSKQNEHAQTLISIY